MMIKKIVVDPRFKINYASFYIYGIISLLGKRIVEFKVIDDIEINTDRECRIGCAIKIITTNSEKRLYIDYGDWKEVYQKYYDWSDLYAKINVTQDDVSLDKLLAIGPSFGIKLWNPIKCIYFGIKNFLIIKSSCNYFSPSVVHYLMDYGYMFIRRKGYKYYYRFTDEEQCDYCFSFNTLWYDNLVDNTTNKLRGEFMWECKKNMHIFEGGFYFVDHASVHKEFPSYQSYLNKYKDLISKHRISMDEYNKKIRKSLFVFNTPSVGGCHGWKLAEYLCEGKAIISTKLQNIMPGCFSEGVHYIKADNPSEMRTAIIRLKEDGELVKILKNNAFQYYNEYLAPEVVIKRIFEKLELITGL